MKFMKLEAVKSITGLSKSSIYLFIHEGRFPSPVKLGRRSVAWVASEIDEGMTSCIVKRENVDVCTNR
ncbi:AlpA family transcriptional regulator [Nitrosomonas ureae]|uniref:Transcriptional regulator, AlpA family n=1 Tax=Nitrosomonas ureae TaxID=44577 RepID=A0A286A752_9PROT|nr:AlpA family transcriptional regulator [Nitrosomonas ureae]SOD17716.1 transcriptional regulator, AlpA family [Nitrosomonas ureae]